MRHVAVVVLAFLSACDSAPAGVGAASGSANASGTGSSSTRLPAGGGDGFLYAALDVTDAPQPARYAAALPRTRAEVEALQKGDVRFPPPSWLGARLCAAVPAETARAVAAVEAAAVAERDAVARGYGELLRYCDGPKRCVWAKELVAKEATRALGYAVLSHCGDVALLPLFDRPEAPAAAVATWYSGFYDHGPAFTKRLGEAAEQIAKEGDDDHLVRTTAFALADFASPDALAALRRMHEVAVESDRKTEIAMAMGRTKEPALRAIFRAACAGKPADAMCRKDEAAPLPAPEPAAAAPDPDKLAACAADRAREVGERRSCLAELAGLDRGRAATIAKDIAPRSDPHLDELVAALGFGDRSALVAELARLKVFDRDPDPKGADGATARELLGGAGRLHSFDAETGQFPNEHDTLLHELAALAGGALDDVLFEEIAPSEERETLPDHIRGPNGAVRVEVPRGVYTLHAYVGGKRYRATAQNLGDWYDVAAVVGLLNALCRARGLDLRFAPIATEDQFAHVVVGPAAALRSLFERRLLVTGAAGAAERKGKAFEDRVFEELE